MGLLDQRLSDGFFCQLVTNSHLFFFQFLSKQ